MSMLKIPSEDRGVALLQVADVARLLRVSRRTVHRLVDARRMPAPLRIGRGLRWRTSDISIWLQNGARPVQGAPR